MTVRCHLVIFAKEPKAGQVKTRLARDIGWSAALRFYRGNLRALVDALAPDPRWKTVLAISPDGASPTHPAWVHPNADVMGQGTGDLGARMDRVMRTLPPGPAVIIGSDIVGITRGDIAQAFALLGGHDAVFGPAPDGGYWLVGLKRRPRVPDAFGTVRWSSAHALSDTLANLAGLSIGLLDEKRDVDEARDLV